MHKLLTCVFILVISGAALASDCKTQAISLSDPKFSLGESTVNAASYYNVAEVETLSAPPGLLKYRVIRRTQQNNPPVVSSIVVLDAKSCRLADDAYRPAKGAFDYRKLFGEWTSVGCRTLNYRAGIGQTGGPYAHNETETYLGGRAEFESDYDSWNQAGPYASFDEHGNLDIDSTWTAQISKISDINQGPVDKITRLCDSISGECDEKFRSYKNAYTTDSGFFMEYRESHIGQTPKRIWALTLESNSDGSLTVRTFNPALGVIYYISHVGSERVCSYVRKPK